MKILLPTFLLLLSLPAQAGPHVVGYERFHSQTPSAEGGALLYSELGCANCHGNSQVAIPRKGPSLENLSSRVDRDWVVKFLKDPNAGREGSTMPHMMHGLAPPEIDAITAYLGTLGKGLNFKKSRHANAERGSALYHEKGCVACHAPQAKLESKLAVALPNLNEKTNLVALEHFLSNPSKYRLDGRMPHLPLDKQEAIDIAAHLLDYQSSDPRQAPDLKAWPKAERNMVEQGRALVTKMNCASCHDLPGIQKEKPHLLSLTSSLNQGACISIQPTKSHPHYQLSEKQRASLIAYLTIQKPKDQNHQKGHLTFAAMNCYACHSRNGIGGPTPESNAFFIGDKSLGDSGRIPPPLTGIGHKLQHDWLKGVLSGQPDHLVRPYLKTRMPAYPAHAETLTKWLGQLDSVPGAKPILSNSKDLEEGRKLLGTRGGANCITCHHWGDKKSLGIPALDISSLNQRLRPEWFRSYLLDPAAYRPGTLMPSLWPEGHSSIPDILDGNTERQIAAIWEFIKDGKGHPTGFPDRSGGKFELVPKDRPIIQRTFFKKTGSKTILVGFPGQIHIAYDGLNAHPSQVWKGRFFDAYNTWFTRAAPFEEPLGNEIFEFPKPESKGRFRGYRLDASGNPIFLIQSGGRKLEERFSVSDGKLSRMISWTEGTAPVVTHPKGVEVAKNAKKNTLTFIYSWK